MNNDIAQVEPKYTNILDLQAPEPVKSTLSTTHPARPPAALSSGVLHMPALGCEGRLLQVASAISAKPGTPSTQCPSEAMWILNCMVECWRRRQGSCR